MFMFVGQATAGPDSKYKTGDRHPVLIFVSRETQEEAFAFALAEMPSLGWEQIKFHRSGIIDEMKRKDDLALSGAYRTAEAGGCGIVVYSTTVS